MKISLMTVSFNAEATIADAMQSVWDQELPDGVELDYVVVDGLSRDSTVEKIRAFDARVKAAGRTDFTFRWVSEKDRGLYDAINKGIRMATGEVVGICNADDIMADDRVVVKLAEAFARGGDALDAVYADIRFVRAGDSVEALRKAPTARYCTGRYFRNWMFRFATFPAHPSTFVRKACFEKFGYYSLDYRICADFELMLRLFYINKIRAKYLPFCTHVMRMGGLSTGGFRSNVQINREDLRALRSHGVRSCLPLIYLKYLFKVWGFLLKR